MHSSTQVQIDGIAYVDALPEVAGTPNLYESTVSIFFSYFDEIENLPDGSITVLRTWTVFDWCSGSTRQHIQTIKILNPVTPTTNPAIVFTCEGEEVTISDIKITTDDPEVTVDASECKIENNDIVSFINCVIERNPIKGGHKYAVDVVKSSNAFDYLNGVSTLDLVLIQRHILQIASLDNSCKIAAADVSNEGRLTVVDLVELRRLILGTYATLPNAPSWKFMHFVDGELVDLEFDKDLFPLQDLEIRAIKIGDVNGSAIGGN